MIRTKLIFRFAGLAGSLLACVALGKDAPLAPPLGPKPGPELEVLKTVFRDMTFRGHIPANIFWTGAPEVPGSGSYKCNWILGGMWVSCYIQGHYGPVKGGKGPLADGRIWTWTSQLWVGWDIQQKAYRWLEVDNEGEAYDMVGRVEGSKFIAESSEYQMSQGIPQKFRFAWDFRNPNAMKFQGDNLVKGQTEWVPADISIYTPTK